MDFLSRAIAPRTQPAHHEWNEKRSTESLCPSRILLCPLTHGIRLPSKQRSLKTSNHEGRISNLGMARAAGVPGRPSVLSARRRLPRPERCGRDPGPAGRREHRRGGQPRGGTARHNADPWPSQPPGAHSAAPHSQSRHPRRAARTRGPAPALTPHRGPALAPHLHRGPWAPHSQHPALGPSAPHSQHPTPAPRPLGPALTAPPLPARCGRHRPRRPPRTPRCQPRSVPFGPRLCAGAASGISPAVSGWNGWKPSAPSRNPSSPLGGYCSFWLSEEMK